MILYQKRRYYGGLCYLATTESMDCAPSIILFNCCSSGIMTKCAGLAVLHPWRWHESWSEWRSCWQHEQYHCSCVLGSRKMLMKNFFSWLTDFWDFAAWERWAAIRWSSSPNALAGWCRCMELYKVGTWCREVSVFRYSKLKNEPNFVIWELL